MNIRSSIAAVLLAAGATSSFSVTVVTPAGFSTYTASGSFKYTSPTVIAPLGFGRLDGFGRADSASPSTASRSLASTSGLATTLADPGYTPGSLPFNYLDVWNFTGLTMGTYNVVTNIHAEESVANNSLAIGSALLSWYSGGQLHTQSLLVASDFGSASGTTSITVDSDCGTNACVFVQILGWEDKTNPTRFYNATIASVPEPETYAMLLAGLGVIGFVARRRSSAPASTRHALKVL